MDSFVQWVKDQRGKPSTEKTTTEITLPGIANGVPGKNKSTTVVSGPEREGNNELDRMLAIK